jgi:hypothetical protein
MTIRGAALSRAVLPTPSNSSVAAINAARGFAEHPGDLEGEYWQRGADGTPDAARAETRNPPLWDDPTMHP